MREGLEVCPGRAPRSFLLSPEFRLNLVPLGVPVVNESAEKGQSEQKEGEPAEEGKPVKALSGHVIEKHVSHPCPAVDSEGPGDAKDQNGDHSLKNHGFTRLFGIPL